MYNVKSEITIKLVFFLLVLILCSFIIQAKIVHEKAAPSSSSISLFNYNGIKGHNVIKVGDEANLTVLIEKVYNSTLWSVRIYDETGDYKKIKLKIDKDIFSNLPVDVKKIKIKDKNDNEVDGWQIYLDPFLDKYVKLGDDSIYIIAESDFIDNAVTVNMRNEGNYSHSEINKSHAPYDSLVAYWNFDVNNVSDSITHDWSDSDNDGTVSGATWNSSGGFNEFGAYDFDGADDKIDINNHPSLNNLNNSYTVCAWVYPKATYAITRGIFSKSGSTYQIQFLFGTELFQTELWDGTTYKNLVGTANSVPINTWSHGCIRYSRSEGNLSIYVNSEHDKTVDVSTVGNIVLPHDADIGRDMNTGRIFNGTIDEMMIFNISLTQQQITDIYNNQSERYKDHGDSNVTAINVSTGQGNVTIQVSNFQNNSGTRIESQLCYNTTGYNMRCRDWQNISSLINATFEVPVTSVYWQPNFRCYSDAYKFYSCILQGELILIGGEDIYPSINFSGATPADGATINTDATINVTSSDDEGENSVTLDWNRSQYLWLRLEYFNSTFTNDSSSYGNDGTIVGADCTVDGYYGEGCSFDGENDYVENNYKLIESFPMTFTGWMKPKEVDDGAIVSVVDKDSGSRSYGIYVDSSNVIKLRCRNTAVDDITGNVTASLNTWYHVVGVWNSDVDRELYVNGVLVGSDTSNCTYYDPVDRYSIGRFGDDSPSDYFNGTIDDVQIHSRALSQTEISALYNANLQQYNHEFDNLADGYYPYTAYAQDLSGQVNSTSRTVEQKLSCSLVSITPNNITINSTGNLDVLVNCSSSKGINTSRFILTSTVETPGVSPNYWSIRPPSNNLAQIAGNFTDHILRAYNRNKSGWYEMLFTDVFSYSVYTGDDEFTEITKGEDWGLFNLSWNVESLAFKQMIYIDEHDMLFEEKKDYSMYKDNTLLVKMWDLKEILDIQNYTMRLFINLNYTDSPNKNLDMYYCNSSYNLLSGVSPDDDVINCVFLEAFDEALIDSRFDYSIYNSSYIVETEGVFNGKIGGVGVTNTFYLYFKSQANQPTGTYILRYANGTSQTNVSLKDTQVAWTSTDNGVTFTQAEFTPDIWIGSRSDNDTFDIGFSVMNNGGINLTNLTFYSDKIEDADFPISRPDIHAFQNFLNTNISDRSGEDVFLNESYSQYMTIHVNIAMDPDAVGAVNHSLYLTNTDGSINFTINNSFDTADDSDIHVFFNTSLVSDGLYRMNITAVANDNPNDMESTLTFENFTIDNTHPSITLSTIPLNGSITNQNWIYANISVDDAAILNYSIFLYNSTGLISAADNVLFTNFTSLNDNMTYYINATVYDVAGNMNRSDTNKIILDGCYPVAGNWFLSCSRNCAWNSPLNISSGLTLNGTGSVLVNSVISFISTSQSIIINAGCSLVMNSGGQITG